MATWHFDEALRPAAAPPPGADKGGVFESFLVTGGAVPLWRAHETRLRYSAAGAGIALPPDPALLAPIREALRPITGPAKGRLTVLAGAIPGACRGALLETLDGPVDMPPQSLWLVPVPTIAMGDIKATARDWLARALETAQRHGANHALICMDGFVTEVDMGNIFFLIGGRIVTPRMNGRMLVGIARTLALWEAPRAGIAIAEDDIPAADVNRAEAALMTTSVRGAVPIASIGGRALAPDADGLGRLGDLLRDRVRHGIPEDEPGFLAFLQDQLHQARSQNAR